ncbi:MAG: heat-shock protein Hsp20 [Deltaproteobacteria bacterium]|jgi:HSP20 family protein|nr:heat-shock protein Hsp20 [Deltaproteobacteria bacterium]
MDWKKIAPWNWFQHEEAGHGGKAAPSSPAPTNDPISALRLEMDRLFDEVAGRPFLGSPLFRSRSGASTRDSAPLRPSVDISEGRKAYTVRVELPGVEGSDVSLEIEDGHTLILRAEKRQDHEEENEDCHCVESTFGAVQRILSLPEDADAEATEAKFKNGVLKLKIPKQPARSSTSHAIKVQAG